MRYVGLQTQIWRNNTRSVLLLLAFPLILIAMIWAILFVFIYVELEGENYYYSLEDYAYGTTALLLQYIHWIIIVVGGWFLIAYWTNAEIVKSATKARTLERRENPRVYNIVENLCMTCNMDMPKINIIDDPMLNAFASGINKRTYTVTVTTGLLAKLNDAELAGVIGHELTHIRNKDTRLLIISIVFVGIISTVAEIAFRMCYYSLLSGGSSRSRRNSKDSDAGCGAAALMLIIGLIASVAYIFTLLPRFAISRMREYMADAGGAELCGDPLALASALRKISNEPGLEDVNRDDIAQLYIMRPAAAKGCINWFKGLFSTHPDPQKRIAYLEQF